MESVSRAAASLVSGRRRTCQPDRGLVLMRVSLPLTSARQRTRATAGSWEVSQATNSGYSWNSSQVTNSGYSRGTYKAIPKGSELLVYYGDAYARELNINTQTFRKAPAAAPPGTASLDGSMLRCAHCDYTCLRRDQLDTHMKWRHGHIGRNGKYKCEWCDYSTDDVTHHNCHRLTHTGERPHRCDDCGRTFSRPYTLTRHRRMHTGQRPYSCDVCGKAFTCSCDLTTHRRLHTGEKVRQCEQCGAAFSRVSHYVTHMKTHSGVKAYRCQVCSARFVRRPDLITHMRTHTGERPYGCSVCPARFSRQSHMKNHVTALHTHDYRHRCAQCGKGFVTPRDVRKHVDKCSAAD